MTTSRTVRPAHGFWVVPLVAITHACSQPAAVMDSAVDGSDSHTADDVATTDAFDANPDDAHAIDAIDPSLDADFASDAADDVVVDASHADGGNATDAGTRDRGRTFESDAPGTCPTGLRCEGTVSVADVTVDGTTTRAVRVRDASTTAQSRLFFLHGGVPARKFDFDALLRGTASTILAVHGTGASESTGTWRFLVAPAAGGVGVISVYNGAWTEIGRVSGLHDANNWSRITIEASTTWCAITARGRRFTTYRKAAVASEITSLEVASAGTAPTGTDTFVDNYSAAGIGAVVAQETGGYEARFPDIARLHDGRLMAVWHSSPSHTGTATNNSRIRMSFSSDDGLTWSAPRIAMDTSNDDRDPKITVLADGTVLLVWFQDLWSGPGAYDNLGVFTARMAPGATSFGAAHHVPTASGRGFEHAPAVEAMNGDVVLAYYNSGARVIRSHDGGATWDGSSDRLVAGTTATRSFVEPNIARLPSGQLVMLIRTIDRSSGDEIASMLTRSNDNGLTWSSPVQTDFVTASHHMLTTSDGRVLLTYGYPLWAHRPTLAAMIDHPEMTWSTAAFPGRLFYNSGADDQANPSSVELRDGRFLTLGYNVTTAQLLAYIVPEAFY